MNVVLNFLPAAPVDPEDIVLDFSAPPTVTAASGWGTPWNAAARKELLVDVPWKDSARLDVELELRHKSGAPIEIEQTLRWAKSGVRDRDLGIAWGVRRARLDASTLLSWKTSLPIDTDQRIRWGLFARAFAVATQLPWRALGAVDVEQHHRWGLAQARDTDAALPWNVTAAIDKSLRVVWGPGGPSSGPIDLDNGGGWDSDDDYPPIDPVPIEVLYTVNTNVTLLRLPDNTPVECLSASAWIDRTSKDWSFEAVLARAADLEVLAPDESGQKFAQLTINGYPWIFRVEDYEDDWTFGKRTFKVHGRGLSAELDAPYAAPRTNAYDADFNAQQIAQAELDSLFGSWTLDWQIVDWLVPANTFSYSQKTPMEVISQIAAAVGGIVQPDPLTKTLLVLPRYTVSPMDWGSATVDGTLPLSVLTGRALKYQPGPTYNRVFVAGQANGVLVRATRTGSAGDLLAPQVVDPLICAVEAGTARGKAILDDSGNIGTVTIPLPLFTAPAAPGLLRVGQLLQIGEGTPGWRGLVDGIRIDAKLASVFQSATLQRRLP